LCKFASIIVWSESSFAPANVAGVAKSGQAWSPQHVVDNLRPTQHVAPSLRKQEHTSSEGWDEAAGESLRADRNFNAKKQAKQVSKSKKATT
jgi:hypothetical protein